MRLHQSYRLVQQTQPSAFNCLTLRREVDNGFQFVLPENIAHALLTTLFLLSGQWTAFILNAPLVAFNINKCVVHHVAERELTKSSVP